MIIHNIINVNSEFAENFNFEVDKIKRVFVTILVQNNKEHVKSCNMKYSLVFV